MLRKILVLVYLGTNAGVPTDVYKLDALHCPTKSLKLKAIQGLIKAGTQACTFFLAEKSKESTQHNSS